MSGVYKEEMLGSMTSTRGNSKTPILDQYSRDLTEMAREGKLDPVIGRQQEIGRVIQILSRRTKNNPWSDWRTWSWKNGNCGGIGKSDCHRECA